MLKRFFPTWFPHRTLDGVGTGAFVELPVRVVSPNAVELALVSDMHAALVHWTLLYQHTSYQGGGVGSRAREARLVRFFSGWRGAPLLVRSADGQTIEVPLARLHLEAPIDPEDGVPLGTTLRSAQLYGDAARRAPEDGGMVYVREHGITHAQSLVIRGRVVPVQRVASGYRDQPADSAVDFRTDGDVVLVDDVLG